MSNKFEYFLLISCLISAVTASIIVQVPNDCYEENEDIEKYEPTWGSLDSRPIPNWYDEAKIGIMLHWGVYSVPDRGSEWFWFNWRANQKNYVDYMKEHYPPGFTYQDFGKAFKTELFDPVYWAKLFEDAGAKYVVLTSKHHDGYAMWPSKYAFSWNSMDLGAHRDLIGDLAEAIRNNTDLKFGLYYSLYEWFNPIYLADKANCFESNDFVNNKMLPEMFELVTKYRPSIFWADGDWEASDAYFMTRKFLTWLYNDSPVKNEIVVNDRWGVGIPCHHGGYFTCRDRYDPGVLQPHKWENAMTLDKQSWGYRREARLDDYLTTKELITVLIRTIACGGNILINVGPTKEGLIDPIFEERLRELGAWLEINGKAVYNTKPWDYQNDTLTADVWFTTPKVNNSAVIYAFMVDWPESNVLEIEVLHPYLSPRCTVRILGEPQDSQWTLTLDTVQVLLPSLIHTQSTNCWVLAFTCI
ncbi:alpha-L-fucosidase-like [Ctenocephalides felis]|uniref:alpha-L-fucosidase-like n=1 Tax=Ctenocephalides felis TaxID=7515 RepID=UPI000E6E44CD|nr:alpha-L-fucosidase-like [Ctenocephalides felis]